MDDLNTNPIWFMVENNLNGMPIYELWDSGSTRGRKASLEGAEAVAILLYAG